MYDEGRLDAAAGQGRAVATRISNAATKFARSRLGCVLKCPSMGPEIWRRQQQMNRWRRQPIRK